MFSIFTHVMSRATHNEPGLSTGQLVLILHSHDRHAFSCLVPVQAFKIISLAECYSPRPSKGICYFIQNYFSQWSSHFELFPRNFSRWSF